MADLAVCGSVVLGEPAPVSLSVGERVIRFCKLIARDYRTLQHVLEASKFVSAHYIAPVNFRNFNRIGASMISL